MSRLSLLSSAFRDVPLTCGALTLRPITAGSVLLLMETKNALFADGGDDSDSAAFQGMFEFIHIHTAPLEEVVADAETPGVIRAKARQLALGISFEDLAAFQQQFDALRSRMNASLVDIVPEKGDTGKPAAAMPAPIGSPPSSTPSVAPETPPASNGFSGGCPSPVPSNTSMPPTALEEPEPSGKPRIWDPPQDFATPDLEQLTPLP